MTKAEEELLANGLRQLDLNLSAQQQHKMLAYLELIIKWNRTHNLTAITDLLDMVVKHLLDSLSILPYFNHNKILDVGSGAGLPSIPLAIANPRLNITALDASHKRVIFIRQVVRELNIPNVEAIHARVEEFNGENFDIVCSRAFSSLRQFTESSSHLLATDGRWFAMKGNDPTDEKEELPENIKLVSEHPLKVPGLSANRCLLVLQASNR